MITSDISRWYKQTIRSESLKIVIKEYPEFENKLRDKKMAAKLKKRALADYHTSSSQYQDESSSDSGKSNSDFIHALYNNNNTSSRN